jgi:hypothetical protein
MSAVIKDEGDGALTEQEITELVQYLESLNPGMSAKQ